MAKYRRLAVLLIALAAAVAIASIFLAGNFRWFALIGLGVTSALVIGLLLARRSAIQPGDGDTRAAGAHDFPIDLLNATLNEMREGLLSIDNEMRIVASNRAAEHLFTNVDDSIKSKRLTELTRNPAIYEAFLEGVRGNERAGVKVETFAPDRRVFDLRVVPLHTGNGTAGAVGVFFDVTRLERLELIRQEFLSTVSHELRTPLTSIGALAETLEAGALNDPNNNQRFLSIIQKNAARMHRLIDDILELSAIEAGNVKIYPEPVPLYSLVEDVINSVAASAISRKISVRNLVVGNAQVFADPHRLVQMLTNLIENAIKFNRDGGTVSIRLSNSDKDRISVEDT